MVRYHSFWDISLVFLSLGLSILGALTGVMLMDQRRETKSARIKAMLTVATAFAFGGVGLYGMNTVAIVSLELKDPNGIPVPLGYDVEILFFIFLVAVVFVYAGLLVASTDRFFGMSREERLKELISDVKRLTSNNITVKKLMRQVEYRALFGDLRRIALGGCLTVFGIYTVAGGGFFAMNGNVIAHPALGGIFGIIVLPFFTATLAYWIIFRVNEWRRKESWLRIFSAVILGGAFAFTRSIIYVGAKYYSTQSLKPIDVNKTNVTLFTVTASLLYSLLCFTAIVILQRKFVLEIQEDLGNLHRFYLQLRTFQAASSENDPSYVYRLEAFVSQFGLLMAKQSERRTRRGKGGLHSQSSAPIPELSLSRRLLLSCIRWLLRSPAKQPSAIGSSRKVQPFQATDATAMPARPSSREPSIVMQQQGGGGEEAMRGQGGGGKMRAPSIMLSTVLPDFLPGASILSTIMEEEEEEETDSLADSASAAEEVGGRLHSGAGGVGEPMLPGEVMIKVKQVNDTTVVVTQTSIVDGSLRKRSIKYECVDQEALDEQDAREPPAPHTMEDLSSKAGSGPLARASSAYIKEGAAPYSRLGSSDLMPAQPGGGGGDAASVVAATDLSDSGQLVTLGDLADHELEDLAHGALGLLEGRNKKDTNAKLDVLEAHRRGSSLPQPQSMLVFSSGPGGFVASPVTSPMSGTTRGGLRGAASSNNFMESVTEAVTEALAGSAPTAPMGGSSNGSGFFSSTRGRGSVMAMELPSLEPLSAPASSGQASLPSQAADLV